ncbi:DUF1800 domain-containing protein [Algibacillus agarilyticus]|uniref:DUF1800 domain-containing protein n=1 Tax=Algibacillus agarilyticus TaxID=2234133 RepID=UPI000DD08864|nr:DUF1800 domain-containing protein [Algibacillus agarilyticus]
MTIQAVIATNRFGYGAKPDEINLASSDPKTWLLNQLHNINFNDGLTHSNEVAVYLAKYNQQQKQMKKSKSDDERAQMMQSPDMVDKKLAKQVYSHLSANMVLQAVDSNTSFSWRLLDFFSNHFSVTGQNRVMQAYAATLEREAIAPNLVNKFEDMLLTVTQHPAMLIYLNNERSFGANSKRGKQGKGLNENLAREILELHTLGVNGGYTQKDVIALANGITGWSVANPLKDKTAGFKFVSKGHEPRTQTLLNTAYPQQGFNQGKQMLIDLARHPSTANFVCTKLVKHFVSDKPKTDLVNKMVATWMRTQGNLKQVLTSMLTHSDAWHTEFEKFKTPREFLISTLRALPNLNMNEKQIINALTELGQKPLNAGSPAGFSDDEADWLGASAIMARIDMSAMLANRVKKTNIKHVLTMSLGSRISEHTRLMITRAESAKSALTLLLMSPEFQRR